MNRSGGGNLVDPNKLADYAQLQVEAEVLASDWENSLEEVGGQEGHFDKA